MKKMNLFKEYKELEEIDRQVISMPFWAFSMIIVLGLVHTNVIPYPYGIILLVTMIIYFFYKIRLIKKYEEQRNEG